MSACVPTRPVAVAILTWGAKEGDIDKPSATVCRVCGSRVMLSAPTEESMRHHVELYIQEYRTHDLESDEKFHRRCKLFCPLEPLALLTDRKAANCSVYESGAGEAPSRTETLTRERVLRPSARIPWPENTQTRVPLACMPGGKFLWCTWLRRPEQAQVCVKITVLRLPEQ
jgi:hypothetical protein